MSTPSANILETAVAGKYSRIFVSNTAGSMYPVNCIDWKCPLKTTDIPLTGFEDFGFQNGLTGIVGIDGGAINAPVQFQRSGGGALGNALALLPVGRFFVYECWLINPDFSALFGTLARFTGVAQVIETPVENEVNGKPMANITWNSRGAIYLPTQVAPAPAAMLSLFTNALT